MGDIKRSFLWSYTGFFLRALLGFGAAPIIISSIGATGYGVFLSLSLYSYNGVFQLFDFGFPLLIQKEYPYADESSRRSLYLLQLLSIILSFVFICLIFLMLKDKISQFHEFSYFSGNTIVLLLVLNNFIGLAHTYPGTRLICEGNLSIVKKNEAFQSLFWVVTGCASVIMSKKFIDFFLILNILSQIIAFIFMVKKINSPFDLVSGITQLRFFLLGPSSFIKKNLTYSLLLKLNGFTFKQSDSLMVSFFLGEKDLAILDISLKFLSFFKVMLGKMNELVFVKFTRSTDVKKEVPTALFGRILNVLFIISLCYSVFIFVFSDYLMELWLGDSFQPSYPWLLRLSSLVVLTLPLSQTVPSYLIAIEKKIDETVKSIAFISVLNVFVTFFLIKFAKIEGVIISTLFQQLLLGKVLFNRCRFEIKQRKLIQKNFFISFFILLSYLILANIGLLSVSNLWITSVLLVYLLFMMFYNSLIDEIFFLVRN